ncbi:MAG TPA: DUF4124 domain-containing protein [Chromatiaceae bacterium]|jgi:hypothetical protein|nr:DUF4124 domain-containing protein [Chromatiaceae bacterium]HIB83781.1 DUF4124 domain-containing protein [Chromatiaceae bacterium]
MLGGMNRISVLLALCICSLVVSAEIYRWVDERGQIQYSDRYHEGSEPVPLDGLTTYKSRNRGLPAARGPKAEPASIYQQLSIQNPQPDQSVRANDGRVQVSLLLQPPLRAGDQLGLTLDGITNPDRLTSSQFSLTEVVRGTHTLGVSVYNASGNTLISADPVVFHVLKTSVIKPN